ncbi:disintegrin and metalloproteinase domain-containing protein 10-like isoform X2 [Tigriopus californicus]|uniref:disintegrin and metalloproteinase domain-containing protein 10-like isoform X2 n=1 Tax=Tigriopus californicus TaxID=6832 RepID=UPI0027DA1B6D|nr:disintegrin and metalloproteinase domain-containing protein 10-like isoform X2 [Tigriopus californicus]
MCAKYLFCVTVVFIPLVSSWETRFDLKDVLNKYTALTKEDMDLRYREDAKKIHLALQHVAPGLIIDLAEDQSFFDIDPKGQIFMCNGTAVNLRSGDKGIAYGSFNVQKRLFSGEIVFAQSTFYLEDADKYLKHSGNVLSILYEDSDVVPPQLEPDGNFEMDGKTLPEANVTLIEPQFSNLKGPEYNKCHMQFIVDNGVWNEFDQQKAKIKSYIYQHVRTLNRIFQSSFTRNGRPAVEFVASDIRFAYNIYCERNHNVYCKKWFDSYNGFLNEHSDLSFNYFGKHSYCLSYLVTNREFKGTLGVAFVNGVCTDRSNTGFFIMNQRTVTSTSELTFAHEVGHNLGASHDTQRSCLGSSYFGNYLMYPSISSNRQPNNDKLSSCSQRSILRTLGQLLEGRRNNCFQNTKPSRAKNTMTRGQHSSSLREADQFTFEDDDAIVVFADSPSCSICMKTWLLWSHVLLLVQFTIAY